ncbi:MAG: thiamine-phosphate kinase [Desulfobacterales bacterium]
MLNLKQALRFYYITDDSAPDLSPVDQAAIAISAGATMIQYRNKRFTPRLYEEVTAIRDLCRSNRVPFIINDDLLLAKAVKADGVHLGQEDESPSTAATILGAGAIIGVSVSTPDELAKTDLSGCDYIGTGPVYPTGTKSDAKAVIGLEGLKKVAAESPVPVVAIGGIDESNAAACFANGASGISLITAVSRAANPVHSARTLARICGCDPRHALQAPWHNEFALIEKLTAGAYRMPSDATGLLVPGGDDTALLKALERPVITTDTHREGVHFNFRRQTEEDIGQKAVEITFSDLAAAYAEPVCLFINLGIPPGVSDQTICRIYDGINMALRRHGCEIGGGNIAAAERLALDLFAVGRGKKGLFPVRSAAKSGYGLYCTGPLGMARAGLALLMENDYEFPELTAKFLHPKARFDAAKILADHGVECVMDISDGLAGDAAHIAKASQVTIRLEVDPGHLNTDLIRFSNKHGLSAMELAVAGGEDYELLFACPKRIFEQMNKSLPDAYPVGECLPPTGTLLVNPPENMKSFQHGA